MRFCLPFLVLLPLLLTGCEKPCPKGQQRYGVKCVKSPVPEGGVDAEEGGAGANTGLEGGMSNTQDEGGPSSCIPPDCHPCELEPCRNAGVCSETETGFECTCKVGFSGRTCAVDICVIDPCVHGECVRTAAGRECKCEPGYIGDACQTNTDASLASLTVSAGTLFPAFKPNVHEYSVDLGISAPEIYVTATAAVPTGVSLSLDGITISSGTASERYSLELNASKVVAVDVTAEDGTKLSYNVTIRRSLVQQAYVKRSKPVAREWLGGGTGGIIPFWGQSLALLLRAHVVCSRSSDLVPTA